MLERVHYYCKDINEPPAKTKDGYEERKYEDVPQEDIHRANLVSSELTYFRRGKLHAPALDIDVPITCYESSTPGHHHLLIDVPMPWWRYRLLLRSLWKAGIIEEKFYKMAVRRHKTMLRRKGFTKNDKPAPMTWQ